MVHVSKWQRIVNDLAKTPGIEKLVAEDHAPSAATRLRQLGATVRVVATAPRGLNASGRYDIYAMVEGHAATLAHLSDEQQRHELIIKSYDRNIAEYDEKLERNTKQRNELLAKKRADVNMRQQLISVQDQIAARLQLLQKEGQDG